MPQTHISTNIHGKYPKVKTWIFRRYLPDPSLKHTHDAIFFNGVAHIIMGREASHTCLNTHISRGHCTPCVSVMQSPPPSTSSAFKITCCRC